MKKIVVLDGYTLNPGDLSWERLKELGSVEIYDRTQEDQIEERVGDCEIVITNKTPITRELLERKPGIKYVGVLATGYNVVDIEAARDNGVVVTNIPTYGTEAVAQYVFALLLELCHRVAHHDRRVKEGAWSSAKDFCFWDYPLMELAGKTMGLIGYGRIGQATARIAKAFGMEVLVYDLKKTEGEGVEFVDIETLYKRSDVVSLHCPLTEDNLWMINSESMGKMKRGVLLINTSRGPLIDEGDLAEALNRRAVGGAALDVLAEEPAREDNPLLKAHNCIITPHIAWAPKEARERLLNIAVDNLEGYLKGSIENRVA
ncbi:glycerate dehydrogenase [Propionigenium maris DSM 9537]|uniref:Glycerate dehydrogenase n=1 Tax=Propionigenium maris DSM 9537 TaxID=1123000 RepID=A0A9W6LPH8_9FUSO|nr:D-2-hydroxyacid dehydrogenase [Propionigenium maris]GLI58024.1 glycerate dehydrogenase [Propionigenium maris DSM 9537]